MLNSQTVEVEQSFIDAAKFLNCLLELQPNLRQMFSSGMAANESIEALETIYCRDTIDGPFLTMTGIISGLTRAIAGESDLAICSVWNDDTTYLLGFAVRTENDRKIGCRQNTVYAPQDIIDYWDKASPGEMLPAEGGEP
jgi:hypothetical protein